MRGRQKTDSKREEILLAATFEFAQRDYDQVLMDDVAARAGVGKGTLYRYFPTKEELMLASVLRGVEETHTEFLRMFEAEARLEDLIEDTVGRMLVYFADKGEFLALMQRFEHRLPEEDRAGWLRRRSDVTRAITGALQRENLSGRALAAEPEIAADLLLGMVRSAVLQIANRRDEGAIPHLARQISHIFLHGVLQSAPRLAEVSQ